MLFYLFLVFFVINKLINSLIYLFFMHSSLLSCLCQKSALLVTFLCKVSPHLWVMLQCILQIGVRAELVVLTWKLFFSWRNKCCMGELLLRSSVGVQWLGWSRRDQGVCVVGKPFFHHRTHIHIGCYPMFCTGLLSFLFSLVWQTLFLHSFFILIFIQDYHRVWSVP